MYRSPYHVFIRPYLNRSKRSTTRFSFFALSLLLVVVLACKHSSYQSPSTSSGPPGSGSTATSSNNRSLPYGFKSFAPASGHGEVLIGGMTGNVASAALWAALNSLASYFDAKPQVIGAIVSANDDEIQGLLDGTRDGQPVRGMAYVQASGAQCVVAIVDDRADQFAQSSADLVRLAQQSLPTPSETPVALHRTTLADGTALDLPEGWTASSNNGSATGKGPQGVFDFGLDVEVYTPEAAAQYPVRPPLVAAYGDPGRELQELWAQMRIVESPDNIQIIERTPISWWTSGPGEMLHLQALLQGSQREGVAMVLTGPTGIGKWHFYYSAVSCEQASFNKNFPALLRIWQSWKTDDRVFQERLMRAAESMQATSRIIREANAFRQDAMERSSMGWDHYIRGTWPIEDQQTHTRYVPQQDVTALVRQLNESEGYERYHVVPYEQLNR